MFAVYIVSASMLRSGAPAILEIIDGGLVFRQPGKFYEPDTDSLDRAKDPDGNRWIWRRGDVFFAFYSEEEERRFEAMSLVVFDA